MTETEPAAAPVTLLSNAELDDLARRSFELSPSVGKVTMNLVAIIKHERSRLAAAEAVVEVARSLPFYILPDDCSARTAKTRLTQALVAYCKLV